jgi:hypothetical protein
VNGGQSPTDDSEDDLPEYGIRDEHDLSMADSPMNEPFNTLRRLGMGLLFACVFVPFDLLAFLVVLGCGVYICIKTALYLRHHFGAS